MKQEQLGFIKQVAIAGAKAMRATYGESPAVFLAFPITATGEFGEELRVAPIPDTTKDAQAELFFKLARDPEIAAVAMVREAWSVMLKPGEPLPDTLADRKDKKEILMVSVLTKSGQWLAQCPIVDGAIVDAEFMACNDDFEGRFINDKVQP